MRTGNLSEAILGVNIALKPLIAKIRQESIYCAIRQHALKPREMEITRWKTGMLLVQVFERFIQDTFTLL